MSGFGDGVEVGTTGAVHEDYDSVAVLSGIDHLACAARPEPSVECLADRHRTTETVDEELTHPASIARLIACPRSGQGRLRDLTRYRKKLTQTHTAECQRIQKNLENAGIKLDSVASDVLGVSGRAMLRALLAGERDPEVLAELAKGALRRKIPELQRALKGRFAEHHAILIGIILDHIEHLEAAIVALDAQIDAVINEPELEEDGETLTVPFGRVRDRLDTIPGVGKRAAEVIIAEIGTDMSRFPTAGHLASWAGMCPGNNVTGGKSRSGRTAKGNVWLRDVLVQCAWSAARTRDTYLAAQFWRLLRRIGKKKAAMAVGHSILVAAWHILSHDVDYDDLGADWFARNVNDDHRRDQAIRNLHELGYRVTLEKVA